MKSKTIQLIIVVVVLALVPITTLADKPNQFDAQGKEVGWDTSNQSCTRIQDGLLTYSTGHYLYGTPLAAGYDPFGYNYQAHMFNGSYANVYLGREGYPPYDGDDEAYLAENPGVENKWYWPYRDVELVMKWSDEWLANTDCDSDGFLDRHYGYDFYIGSDAWETNHQWGSYQQNGQTCNWDYFVKIIAAPGDAACTYVLNDQCQGNWNNPDGVLIGPAIWNEFAIIQQVENDPCAGINGVQYLSPDHAGFGGW